MKKTAYLLIGSNINSVENIRRAFEYLSEQVIIRRVSSIWETPPIDSDGPDFLNLALEIETGFSSEELKWNVLRKIEESLGRKRTGNKNAPRTMDLDIIVYDDVVLDDKLWTCGFVAVPIAELLPALMVPNSGQVLSQICPKMAEDGGFKCIAHSIKDLADVDR
jgi:2-amino-4-hydroxy-6-hydroxymethyldihydropteridine diphosphokinase